MVAKTLKRSMNSSGPRSQTHRSSTQRMIARTTTTAPPPKASHLQSLARKPPSLPKELSLQNLTPQPQADRHHRRTRAWSHLRYIRNKPQHGPRSPECHSRNYLPNTPRPRPGSSPLYPQHPRTEASTTRQTSPSHSTQQQHQQRLPCP